MIFVTVGAQMPFDRLVAAVDRWAAARARHDVFAQIGELGTPPASIPWVRSMPPEDFRDAIDRCRVVVAHAGMGSIISALQAGKPIILLPRLGRLRETRNDHQVSTARHWSSHAAVTAARDEHHLPDLLDALDADRVHPKISPHASTEMIDALRRFIQGPAPRPSWWRAARRSRAA